MSGQCVFTQATTTPVTRKPGLGGSLPVLTSEIFGVKTTSSAINTRAARKLATRGGQCQLHTAAALAQHALGLRLLGSGGVYNRQPVWPDRHHVAGGNAVHHPFAGTAGLHPIAGIRHRLQVDQQQPGFWRDAGVDSPANIAQGLVTYSGVKSDAQGSTRGSVSAYFSPGGIGGSNNDEDFMVQRAGATANYAYIRASFSRLQQASEILPWRSAHWANGRLPVCFPSSNSVWGERTQSEGTMIAL